MRDGPNQLVAAAAVPRWRKFLAQFADPLVYLLLGAVVVSFVAWIIEGREEVPFEVIVILFIVVVNAVLGYVQEARAEQAVAALRRMAAASAGVMRDGREIRVPAVDVVPGDVLLLAEGDAVSADGRLVQAASLMVAEASLTGESEAVTKDVAPLAEPAGLGDRVNMVFSGTAVTRGRGRAVVTATGMATEIGNVATLLGRTEEVRTPLQREVERIGRMLGIAVVAIAVVVVTTILITADIDEASDFVEVLLVGVSLAVAAVPEGLPAIISVVLALGVQRMARQNGDREEAVIGRDVGIGVGGVLRQDRHPHEERDDDREDRHARRARWMSPDPATGQMVSCRSTASRSTTRLILEEVRSVLRGGSLANDAVLREDAGGWTIQGDPTEAAFLVAEAKIGIAEARISRFERVGEIPFTSERKLMTTFEADDEREGRIAVVTKGAPDVLLTRCTHERIAGEIRPLTDDRRGEMLATIDRLADLAFRTLGVAYRPLPDTEPPLRARVDRARARLSRDGRHHRPAPPRGPDRDRRGPCGRDQDHHDHRRSPPDRGPHRPRSRHHRTWLDGA